MVSFCHFFLTSSLVFGAPAGAPADTLTVFDAGSLALPVKVALDSFAAHTHTVVQQENAGSLETARKLTELGRIPDVLALADYEVFPRYLMPKYVTWYTEFARNRMVITYTKGSITADNWFDVLAKPGVEVGRSDPRLDPAGYRALLVWQLAEKYYKRPGLADRLLSNAPARNMRPKSADLTALVQTGDLDYAWEYESVAQAAGLSYLTLPKQIDLGDPGEAQTYGEASVRVDTVLVRGEPIVYGLSIPTHAPHPGTAKQFVDFLLSAEGRVILRRAHLDVLDTPIRVGPRS
ncbi:MAG TPA: extracellular solute-binding protein [Gemmatimonadaceae bacterium]|nr:extracellular solute-binding protein [Gemmatimonadaceae bacterium]